MTPPAETPDSPRDYHRFFGLLLTDLFRNTPFQVEIESDLSQQQQFLDVIILRRRPGEITERLPDGFENLVDHNLLTFKSLHEPLNAWAMKELIGHYVAYRKLVRPSRSRLLAERKFRLFAVCVRHPHNLARQVPWQKRQAGVYDCRWGTDEVRVVVTGELPREMHNAGLHLFGATEEAVRFGQGAYRPHLQQTKALLHDLFERYHKEGIVMSYTMADFMRDHLRREWAKLTPEERGELLESLPPEERLAGLPPEERLAGLPPEERLAGLSKEQIQAYLEQINVERPAKPNKRRGKK